MKTLTLINIAALVGVMASAIAVVVVRQEHRQRFVELTNLENERDALRIDYGRLQLEQATWADSARIEQIARERLGLRDPTPDDIVVLGR
ncbi:MAG: cell division protein FtsL [Rhodanobacteraceae bacterium]|nr:cell division protein FtsL [Xanthomonadales bacterium]MCP5479053.1 cell division protein FtsL [Rhodanobacteraceae bacterium]HPF73374.1 cell division protein FtsL [Xanthomonadaceae bacterium]HRY00561.1 cell division protein FtsL [Xanthomonadaceae bacterium]